jgi:pimeloyl-ACP methyl ester carboxylesterase
LAGPLGGLILRPWFDRLALAMMVKGYFPTSRLWAAAEVAGEDPDCFFAEAPMAALEGKARDQLVAALKVASSARRRAADAEATWRETLFSTTSAIDPVEAETRRRATSFANMATRSKFWAWRGRVAPVKFDMVRPEAAEASFGAFRERSGDYFQPSEVPVEVSRSLTQNGVTERWLRFDCPLTAIGGSVWAHVFEPEGGYDHTVVMCHGVGMEAELWNNGYHMAPAMVARGLRVIEPEAPWHSRRRPLGVHGGEPFMARGIVGAMELFGSHVREIGALVGWARETSPGRVAVGGISLGALNSQLAVNYCASWPDAMRPDAAMFVTTTDRLDEVAIDGAFARGFSATEALKQAGWDRENVQSWMPLVAPVGEPGIEPDRIIMALGTADTITPYRGGRAFAQRWRIPPENLLESWQGHFSRAIGLARDPAPIERLCAVLRS